MSHTYSVTLNVTAYVTVYSENSEEGAAMAAEDLINQLEGLGPDNHGCYWSLSVDGVKSSEHDDQCVGEHEDDDA